MKFKIDENLHPDIADILRHHGHDAITVRDQGLRGSGDARIADVCKQEARAFVTLDLDFSDIRVYPPPEFQGIVVLRLNDQSRPATLNAVQKLLPSLDREPLAGCLWIVEEYRLRIRTGQGPE